MSRGLIRAVEHLVHGCIGAACVLALTSQEAEAESDSATTVELIAQNIEDRHSEFRVPRLTPYYIV